MSTVFLVALVLFAAPAQADSRKVAILVGANRAVAGRGALRFAHSDAQRMAATLSAVGGFRPHDVLVLKDPEPDELLQGIEEFQSRIDGTSDETTLLFYFSGHADPQSVYTNGKPLALSLLKEKLERSSAKLKIGILDACHGGGWTRAKALVPAPAVEVPVTPLFSSQGTALLASSSGLERAHESDALGASFFTHHLIAGLRGAAEQTAAGEVTLQSAYRYAHTRTVRDSALAANEPQHPSFELNLHGRTDVVMAQLNTAPSLIPSRNRSVQCN